MSFWCHPLDQNTNEKFDKFCPTHSRAEFVKFFVDILVQTMTPKVHFKINWPLVRFIIWWTNIWRSGRSLNWLLTYNLLYCMLQFDPNRVNFLSTDFRSIAFQTSWNTTPKKRFTNHKKKGVKKSRSSRSISLGERAKAKNTVNSFLRYHPYIIQNYICQIKIQLFWEGHKILQNLHQLFDWQYIGQIIVGDFEKFLVLFFHWD